MLALSYELLTRRSELVSLRSDDLELRCYGSFRVLIRRSKVDQKGLGRIAFTSPKTARLMNEWLAWRCADIQPLLCPFYHGCPIDRALEATIVKTAARGAGLGPSEFAAFSGHSMRVGAAQDLLQRGVDTAAIMRAGYWKSMTIFALYLDIGGAKWLSSVSH